MSIYIEEYEIATTLLADLFWGPRKNRRAIEDKLVALNLTIEKKNKRKGLRKEKDEGKIDINYFMNVASQLELCCHLTNKLHGFRTRQKQMKLELRQRQYPEEWNLKESDFLEFANAVTSGKMDLEEEEEETSLPLIEEVD
jgi:SHS2 domain-containing protein